MGESRQQRINMVESQVRPSDVTDRRIIRAMLEVPREVFAPESMRSLAYMDDDLQVGPPSPGKEGRYLLAPRILAKLLQIAEIDPQDNALDVGCATGYSTALLGRLAKSTVAVECDPALAVRAVQLLREFGTSNAEVLEAPLGAGAPAKGPYNVIVLNGSVPHVPQELLDQLADGGRLVAVVSNGRAGEARIWRRVSKTCASRAAFDAGAKPLPGFERQAGFVL